MKGSPASSVSFSLAEIIRFNGLTSKFGRSNCSIQKQCKINKLFRRVHVALIAFGRLPVFWGQLSLEHVLPNDQVPS